MVAFFKTKEGKVPCYQITRDNVETVLGRRYPWFQPGKHRAEDRHFAVCPYCDTPIQLKGLYKQHETSPRPYGSHTGTPIEGFPFSQIDLEFCPYRLKDRVHKKESRRAPGPMATQLIQTALAEFDRIILILRDDFGFHFSDSFAGRMLDQWLDSEGYLYAGAHLRNLPWMIAYFGPSQNLFKQKIGTHSDIAEQIRLNVPNAAISSAGFLDVGQDFYKLHLQCLHHKGPIEREDGSLEEKLTLRIQDFSDTNEPTKAPVIFKKHIVFHPERFEALIHTTPERAKRNEKLLREAQKIFERRGKRE